MSSLHLKQMAVSELSSMEWSVDLNYFKLPTSSKRYVLTPDEHSYLSGVYSLMYPAEETITAVNITRHSMLVDRFLSLSRMENPSVSEIVMYLQIGLSNHL